MSLSMCIVNEIGGFNVGKWWKKLPNSPKLSPSKIPRYTVLERG